MRNKLNLRISKNCKGSTLVTVMIVAAVLAIIGTVLAETVLMQYRIVRSQENECFTYIAAETALERSLYNIQDLCENGNITSGITYNGNDLVFADQVINKISGILSPTPVTYNDIDVLPGNSQYASAKVTLKRYGDHPQVVGQNMNIDIAVTAEASLSQGLLSSYGRKAFAVKKFQVPLTSDFNLEEAIVSIGDLIADNGVTASVLGDVNVYGTSPVLKSQLEQYYYGGIYAKNQSNIIITGNAITRSFIRTGQYNNPANDFSTITIRGDAAAQCIQDFGRKDKIVVYGNAYTFDDLEVDGEDSVIAINGNYFGLNNGLSFHDESSGIINGAPVHNGNSEDSLKSRIVVNGQVLINGATMKINPDGTLQYNLENVSPAWDMVNDMPLYRRYTGTNDSSAFKTWFKQESVTGGSAGVKGFLNLLQVWPSQSGTPIPGPIDPGLPYVNYDAIDSIIGTWLSDIDHARLNSGVTESNDLTGLPSNGTLGTIAFPQNIYGFSKFSIAANDNMYFNAVPLLGGDTGLEPTGTEPPTLEPKGMLRIPSSFSDTFDANLIKVKDADSNFSTWKAFWDDSIGQPGYQSYYNSMDLKLKQIKDALLNGKKVHKLATREYPAGSPNISDTPNPAQDYNGVHQDNIFVYLQTALDSRFPPAPPGTYQHVYRYEVDPLNNPTVPYDIVPDITQTDDYNLVINKDPNRTLRVKGKFNGVIFSMGKVIIGRDADIYGAVIAAGRGYDPDPSKDYVDGSAAGYYDAAHTLSRIPKIIDASTNLDRLEDGSYAGVIFDGSGSGNDPKVTFPGRTTLLNGFYNQADSINLNSIF